MSHEPPSQALMQEIANNTCRAHDILNAGCAEFDTGGEMKAFQIDEESYYAGKTAEDATAAYLLDIGDEGKDLIEEFGPARELDETELDGLVVDVDEPGQPKHSFRQLLAQKKQAGPLASSCY